jgi:lipopolysaccharide exporter
MLSIRSVATVGTGGIAAQIITFLSMPFLTRLYGPDAFAGWALFISLTNLLASISVLRFELALVLPDKDEDAFNIMALSVGILFFMGLTSGIIVFFFGENLLGEKFVGELGPLLWLVPVHVVAFGLYQLSSQWLVRTSSFKAYAMVHAILPLITVSCQALAAISTANSSKGLITGTVAGQFFCTVITFGFAMLYCCSQFWEALHFKDIRKMFIRYRSYPLYMTPYTLLGTIRDRLLFFMLANYGTRADPGLYSLASRFTNAPNNFVAGAMRPVFFQKAATVDFKTLENFITNTIRQLSLIFIPFATIFIFHSRQICAFVFGDKWAEAGPYASVLALPAVLILLTTWLDRSFDVLGKQRLAFLMELLFSAVVIVSVASIMILFENSLFAVACQAVVVSLYYAVRLAVLYQIAGFDIRGCGKLVSRISGALVIGLVVTIVPSLMLSSTYAIGVSSLGTSLCLIIIFSRKGSLNFLRKS